MAVTVGQAAVRGPGASATRARQPRATGEDFGANLGRNLQRGGQAITTYSVNAIEEERDRRLTKARADANFRLKEAQLDFEEDPELETRGERYQKRAEEIRGELSQGLEGRTLEDFNRSFDVNRDLVGLNVRRAAEGAIRQRSIDDFENNLNTIGTSLDGADNTAEVDLGYALAQEEVANGIEKGHFTAERGTQILNAWKQDVEQRRAARLVEADPEAAKEILAPDADRTGIFENLTEDDRRRLNKQAHTQARILKNEARRKENEAKAVLRGELSSAFKDEIASLRATGKSTGQFTSKDLYTAYDTATADRMVKQLQDEQNFYIARSSVATNTPEEDRKLLEANVPEGEGFAAEQQRFELLRNTVQKKREELASDPAGYLFREEPAIGDQFQAAAASGEPDQWRSAIDTMLTEQNRLGVPRYQWRALSKQQVSDMTQAYAGARDAQARADWMRGNAELYGEHWPRVQRELVEGGLPSGAVVLSTMTRPTQARAIQALAEAQQTGRKAMRDLVGKDVAGEVTDGVREALAEFSQGIAFVPGGQNVANTFRQETETLALYYASQGQEASDAATRAASEIITAHYNFRGTYRVPVEEDVDRADASTLVYMRDALPNVNVVAPPSLEPALNEEDRQQQYIRAVQDKGYWVTNGDETGLILMDEQGMTVMEIAETGDGDQVEVRPVELLWSDMVMTPDMVGAPIEAQAP